MPDFRALCADLVKQLEGWQCYASPDGPNAQVLDRARAALSQPEPEGPTDEELLAAQDQAVASFPPIHPELSPAAQAVLDAMYEVNMDFDGENATLAAAALEALADQVVPENYYADTDVNLYEDSGWVNGLEARNEEVRSELLAIAAELNRTNPIEPKN